MSGHDFFMKSKMETNPFWNSVIDCFNEEKDEAFDISEKFIETNSSGIVLTLNYKF